YGAPPPDAEALAACRAMAPRLPDLSAERVAAELTKLLAAPDPVPVLRLMRAEGVLAQVLDEARDLARLARMVRIDAAADPLRRLAALLPSDPAGALAVAQRLRLSNRDRDRLARMAEGGGPVPDDDAAARRRALYASGAEGYCDRVLMGWASAAGEDGWPALLRLAEDWTPPRFPLNGGDVMALGIPAGPRVGELLGAVEAWWVAADFAPDRAACLARLRENAAAG
ncbi:MAG: CCA tRNA nucleotidyltransferase, partial [Alphaproteobacteria bacterium]